METLWATNSYRAGWVGWIICFVWIRTSAGHLWGWEASEVHSHVFTWNRRLLAGDLSWGLSITSLTWTLHVLWTFLPHQDWVSKREHPKRELDEAAFTYDLGSFTQHQFHCPLLVRSVISSPMFEVERKQDSTLDGKWQDSESIWDWECCCRHFWNTQSATHCQILHLFFEWYLSWGKLSNV